MSQRGSFVTEYIYCEKCLEAARNILLADSVEIYGQALDDPIIAGLIRHSSDEALSFELNIFPRLLAVVCHEMRVVVIPEADNPVIFVVDPNNKDRNPWMEYRVVDED